MNCGDRSHLSLHKLAVIAAVQEYLRGLYTPVVSMKIHRFCLQRFTMCLVGKNPTLLQRDGKELVQLHSTEGV